MEEFSFITPKIELMKVLVIGSGGREHALVWKVASSSVVDKIYAAPGNPGISQSAQIVEISPDNLSELEKFVRKNRIDLTLVGPELPLSLGIVDLFQKRKLKIFGPVQKAACLESSKVFAKQFMHKYHIPTASYQVYQKYDEAVQFVRYAKFPLIIKADGLAYGKGAFKVNDEEQGVDVLKKMMLEKIFGESGNQVVIEDFLEGEEVSVMAFTDGKIILPLLPVQDHKTLLDGDQGPNTGGMGSYSPVPFLDQKLQEIVLDKILKPTIAGLKKEGIFYQGILYAGLMLTASGPKVLEYNCRLGDPEAQAVLPLLQTDLVEIAQAALSQKLEQVKLKWKPGFSVCVVLASAGYPGDYEKGKEVKGLTEISDEEVFCFHAGTKLSQNKLVTAGGRVMGVTAVGKSLEKALDKVYAAVDKIYFEGIHYRKDIAYKATEVKRYA